MGTTFTFSYVVAILLIGSYGFAEAQDFSCTGRPDGNYPNPLECTSFYKCSNGYAHLYQCPVMNGGGQLHYNPTHEICDWPEVAGCTSGPTTEPTTPPPTTTPTTTTARAPSDKFNCTRIPDDLFPNEEDCGSYYRCSNGLAYLYQCPTGLHFNPTLKMCDWSYSAGCIQLTTAEETTTTQTDVISTTPSPTDDFDCSDKPSGNYPNPVECTSFYKCSNGYAYLYQCPSMTDGNQLHFNPHLLVCDWPWDAGCNATEITEEPTPTTTPTTTTPTTTTPTTTTSTTTTTPTTTPTTTTTIPTTTEQPTDAPSTTEEEVVTESEAPSSSSLPPPTDDFNCTGLENGLYPNPEDCETFFKCSNGYAYLYYCPDDLHFSPTQLICEWPELAGCLQGPTTTEEPANSTTTEEPANPTTTEEPADPSTTEDPADPTTTEDPADPTTTEEPADSTTTEEPADPTTTEDPSNPTTTEDPANPTTTEKPSDAPSTTEEVPQTNGTTTVITTTGPSIPDPTGTTEGEITDPDPTPSTTPDAPSTTEEEGVTESEAPSSSSLPPPTDDFNCTGLENGLYPNPEDCETFFKCSNGYAYLYYCPDDLHFSPTLLICEWPEQAGCMQGPSTTDGTTDDVTEDTPGPTASPSTESSESPTTVLPTTNNGNETEGTSTVEVTDVTSTSTDWPITTPWSNDTTTTSRPPDFCWGRPCGVYADPTSCEGFIICSENGTSHHTCPPPLRFNPDILTCDLPERVSCFSCNGLGNGLHQNLDNCRTFYMCSWGHAYLFDCPENLIYNPSGMFCDYDFNAWHYCFESNTTTTTMTPTSTTTEQPTDAPTSAEPITNRSLFFVK